MRNVFEEGTRASRKEEDIRSDFPPCLHCLSHTHLVLFSALQTKMVLCVLKLLTTVVSVVSGGLRIALGRRVV